MFNQGGYGIGEWLKSVIGVQPRPREVPPVYASQPRPMNPDGTLAPQAGYDPTPQPVAPQVPQVQEDPLDRFERIARLMEVGERVGSAFDEQPYEVISRGGGVAHPQLPQGNQYGLNVLR